MCLQLHEVHACRERFMLPHSDPVQFDMRRGFRASSRSCHSSGVLAMAVLDCVLFSHPLLYTYVANFWACGVGVCSSSCFRACVDALVYVRARARVFGERERERECVLQEVWMINFMIVSLSTWNV